MIENGKNGLIYHKDSYEEFAGLVMGLVSDKGRMEKLGEAAYETITCMWNAEHAAEELIRFCREWMESGRILPAQEGL